MRLVSRESRSVKGIAELSSDQLPPDRQRRPGAGRKATESEQPSLIEALEKLVDSGTRGDPESPLKWTIKSTRSIIRELRRQKFSVGSTKVGELLKTLGYSLQAHRKTIEGKQHSERNSQFEFIAKRVRQQAKKSEPPISVDTKKEVLGKLKNPGRVLRRVKNPRSCRDSRLSEDGTGQGRSLWGL